MAMNAFCTLFASVLYMRSVSNRSFSGTALCLRLRLEDGKEIEFLQCRLGARGTRRQDGDSNENSADHSTDSKMRFMDTSASPTEKSAPRSKLKMSLRSPSSVRSTKSVTSKPR